MNFHLQLLKEDNTKNSIQEPKPFKSCYMKLVLCIPGLVSYELKSCLFSQINFHIVYKNRKNKKANLSSTDQFLCFKRKKHTHKKKPTKIIPTSQNISMGFIHLKMPLQHIF